ncbi:hypothetical protein L873DRAFT_1846486 [Choiromyces venosus 120613-1]|uniref:Uncharacterized protein n=1 Tax=Choiromyces venosus 120613-1 TaxID=1336337 RepID=A0A3N4JKY7_9PEZI|nr:hypothetical protein L873DRAFT_1846486 [Choiromyces venosus 120613-1]
MPIPNIVRSGRIVATRYTSLSQSTCFASLSNRRGNHTSPQTLKGIKTAVEQLKRAVVVVNVELGNIKSSSIEVKRDIKDLTEKVDQKTDKTDTKIDLAVYLFIVGLKLKGGSDLFMKWDKTEKKDTMGVGK